MDKKQRKKLARAQSRQIIVGMLKNFSIKNCWHFMKEHWKEFLVAGGATLGAATFAGCVSKDNPPAIVQPSGDIESGDINSGDINSGEEKPDIPSGDIGSGDIGSGEEKPEPPSGETPDSGEENPGEETKYPSTIAEMTDEQKKILTDYLDENYLNAIVGKVFLGATTDNTAPLGYDFDLETQKLNILFKMSSNIRNTYFGAEVEIDIKLDAFLKYASENGINSKNEYFVIDTNKLNTSNRSELFQVYFESNEFSENAITAYSTLNLQLGEPKLVNFSTNYYTKELSSIPVNEFGTGNWPVVDTLAITINGNKYTFHMIEVVTKDYNKIGHAAVDTKILDEKYLEFGSENTIFVVAENQPIKE